MPSVFKLALFAAIGLANANTASAQTYGLATMAPGTLAHTAASAIAKVLKEKGGLNTLVQPTAGETVLIPMVAKGEIDLGIANMLEVVDGIETGRLQNDLRVIGSIYTLRIGFFSRKDSGIVSVADLKGKRVPAGYSAMRTLDKNSLAMLATAGLTLADVKPVMVPNVLRGADDFVAGANDTFMFSFGGPKVREADATVGGVRALAIIDTPQGLEASRKVFPYGYFVEVKPESGLRRGREADEVVQHGLHHVHQRQGEGRGGLQDPRHDDEEQAGPGRGCAGAQ